MSAQPEQIAKDIKAIDASDMSREQFSLVLMAAIHMFYDSQSDDKYSSIKDIKAGITVHLPSKLPKWWASTLQDSIIASGQFRQFSGAFRRLKHEKDAENTANSSSKQQKLSSSGQKNSNQVLKPTSSSKTEVIVIDDSQSSAGEIIKYEDTTAVAKAEDSSTQIIVDVKLSATQSIKLHLDLDEDPEPVLNQFIIDHKLNMKAALLLFAAVQEKIPDRARFASSSAAVMTALQQREEEIKAVSASRQGNEKQQQLRVKLRRSYDDIISISNHKNDQQSDKTASRKRRKKACTIELAFSPLFRIFQQ